MRKHDVRKWLHAILDLLPVILIPVFMIYSHRHDVTENVQVNYKYQSNEVNSTDDLIQGNVYHVDNLFIDTGEFGNDNYLNLRILNYELDSWSSNNFGLDEVILDDYNSINENYLGVNVTDDDFTIIFTNGNTYSAVYFTNGYVSFNNCIFQVIEGNIDKITYFTHGNLPQYTDYNVIESVDIENTNVMDSFMNNFNNTIAQHFNMGNVFNLNGVYQWFNTNIFGGNAPTIIFSIWNIALYELVMDLLFLLYGLFMWFIDMIQKLMEKPLNSVR